jgi:glyoxylase-like metal-dependent hydrolase (beta-lactamase superfamily II)
MSTLAWSVYVTPSIPTAIADLPPGLNQRWWSPTSSTLIFGEHDALLVDALLTEQQAEALADWVEHSGKRLTTIYVTHGHADHWFGLPTLLKRFPMAKPVATAEVIASMRAQADPEFIRDFWQTRFPGQIPDAVYAEIDEIEGNSLQLEDHRFDILRLGHTDTDDTTALWVPSVRLLVAGDAVYNDVHLYLGESQGGLTRQWLDALDLIAGVNPQTVVAGHKREDRPDLPTDIAETRDYITTFEQIAAEATCIEELYEAMLRRYPTRVNRGALWGSCRASTAAS